MRDLRCLFSFIDDYLKPAINHIRQLPSVRFHDLCVLFSPGDYVCKKGKPNAWRVLQVTGGRSIIGEPSDEVTIKSGNSSPLLLDCYYLDFDGTSYGPVQQRFFIHHFDGTKSIDALDIQLISRLPQAKKIVESLSEQGHHFLQSTKVCRKQYKGPSANTTHSGEKFAGAITPEQIESQIVLDFAQTFLQNPDWKPIIGATDFAESFDGEVVEATRGSQQNNRGTFWCPQPYCCENENFSYDLKYDYKSREDLIAADPVLKSTQRITKPEDIPIEQYRILPHRAFGFVLHSRTWAIFKVGKDFMDAAKDDKNSFKRLELPDGHKRMVRALVETHRRNKQDDGNDTQQFDVVKGKGTGLIILLHGAPGVGKTSTAECVADALGMPLLPITCGDLGVTADTVEDELYRNFQLAQSWGCILLLDEADVFLAQRSKTELKRNALVSVFLRELEFYSGILFLTTNRVGQIDEAFKSRIHMTLYYPQLAYEQTRKIWIMNLQRTLKLKPHLEPEKDDDGNEKITSYGQQLYNQQVNWNGRQIRNAFQTAAALAEYENSLTADGKTKLLIEHFMTVAKASWEFDDYLTRTRQGQSEADMANINFLRADDWVPDGDTGGNSRIHRYNPPIDIRTAYHTSNVSQMPLGNLNPYPAPQQRQPPPAPFGQTLFGGTQTSQGAPGTFNGNMNMAQPPSYAQPPYVPMQASSTPGSMPGTVNQNMMQQPQPQHQAQQQQQQQGQQQMPYYLQGQVSTPSNQPQQQPSLPQSFP